jgi:hypothetical protein
MERDWKWEDGDLSKFTWNFIEVLSAFAVKQVKTFDFSCSN